MRRLWVVAAMVTLGSGTSAESDRVQARFDPHLLQSLARSVRPEYRRSSSEAPAMTWAPVGQQPAQVFLRGSPDLSRLEALGGNVGTRAGDVTTLTVSWDRLPEIGGIPGVTGIQLARPMTPRMDVSIPAARVDELRMRTGDSWSGLTGKGVIVGIVDSGLDITHPDFQFPDSTSRVLWYWDQADTSGTPPAGFGFGTEWSKAELDGGNTAARDTVGHGTHVSGIAVGNGRGTMVDTLRYQFAGVAPEADIVIVAADQFLDTGVLDAVNYIFSVADGLGRPAVVNLSLGNQFGPHDGTTPLDLGLESLVGPGRLVVAAAGNEGDKRIHAELHVPGGGSDSTTLFVPDYIPGAFLDFLVVDAFYHRPDSLGITVVTPGGSRFGPYRLGETLEDELTGEGTLFLTHTDSDPSTSNLQVQFDLSNFNPDTLQYPSVPGPATGTWRIVFTDYSGAPAGGEVDLWVALSNVTDFAGVPPVWIGDRFDPAEEIASPGSARGIVAVGAYNTKKCWPTIGDGIRCTSAPGDLGDPEKITFFSSRGPTRDGRQKPDVVAPGFVVASSLSDQMADIFRVTFGVERNLDPDGKHFVFAGTSMATPHVTGALALALSIEPDLSPDAARARLQTSARQDEHTGSGWTSHAGFGKLDVAAMLDTVVAVVPRVLHIQATEEGWPRLSWTAAENDPVVRFSLERQSGDYSWLTLGTFAGSGPHTWTDQEAGSQERYRLMAAFRDGSRARWSESTWTRTLTTPVAALAPHPNPFRWTTQIGLRALADQTRVEITVFDARGRKIRSMGPLRIGLETTRLMWDGSDDSGRSVSPGLYWLRIQSGTWSHSSKLVKLP